MKIWISFSSLYFDIKGKDLMINNQGIINSYTWSIGSPTISENLYL